MTGSDSAAEDRLPRIAAIAASAFIGVGALFGGFGLMDDAEGSLGLQEEWLAGSPFPDYFIPGLFLFVVVGLGMVALAAAIAVRLRWWPLASLALGAVLAAWLVIETVIIGWQGAFQAVLLVLSGIPALVTVWVGWRCGALRQLREAAGRPY